MRLLLSTLAAAIFATACGSSRDMRAAPTARTTDAGIGTLDLDLDAFSPVAGAPDRGRDPAVLGIALAGETLCTGVALASNLLITSRRCVSIAQGDTCLEPRDPGSFTVHRGDDPAEHPVLARGRELLLADPEGHATAACDAELALIVLDRDLADTPPLPVRAEPVERGERLRTVSFGKRHIEGRADEPPGKLVREHVPVIDVSATQFQVSEAACQAGGGPAIDEGTGEVLGIVTQSITACDGPGAHTTYQRLDAQRGLLDRGIARAKQMRDEEREAADGGLPRPKSPKKSKPPSDVGQPCQSGVDCATGICVREEDRGYCSRACGGGDRCPAGYRCKDVASLKACIASS